MKRFISSCAVAMGLALAAAGCGGDDTGAAVTTPTVTRTTDTFSGTVQVGSSDFHSFPVAQTGTTDVTLTVAGPPSTIVMGLAIGTPVNGLCVPLAGATVNAQAGATAQLSGLTTPGTLCIQVRDVGNQTGPVTYTVTVLHP